jgi:putative acetyltransferase
MPAARTAPARKTPMPAEAQSRSPQRRTVSARSSPSFRGRSTAMEAERYPRRIEIRRETYGSEAARALTDPLAEELLGRHGRPGSGGEPSVSDFEPPGGVFLVGSVSGADVACGGVCRYDTETAEIRRMYVIPAHRGGGLSRRMLRALEDEARGLGYRRARLETGIHQHEALNLYRSVGFEEIPGYGPYADDELSVCFEKRL